MRVSKRTQQNSVHVERALAARDRDPFRRLQDPARSSTTSASTRGTAAIRRETARTCACGLKRDAFADKRLRCIAATAQYRDQHVLAVDGSRLRCQRLLARHPEHMEGLFRRRHLTALRRRTSGQISKTTVGGLARDPQRARHVAEGPTVPKPAADLRAGENLKLVTQLDQRLERAHRILSIGRLLSQTA